MVTWVDRAIEAASAVVAIAALVAMFISLMAEVVVRYLTNQGMGWPTEMPNILFPWLVMGGVVLAAQRGQHIAVTAIQGVIGRVGNRVLLIAHQILIAGTFFYLAWVGLDVIEITGSEIYPVTGLSAKWAYLAMIVGFVGLGLTALTTLVHLLHAVDPLSVRAHRIEEDV
ncbi:TRAP transporter permease DctQ [Pseudomonas sp. M30-35]|nr:TRAP transporter permease DctQ [Pseudomonas sp. M30-35]